MTALLLCYHSTSLCSSTGDISASVIYYLCRFLYQFIVTQGQVGLDRVCLLLRRPILQHLFVSTLLQSLRLIPSNHRCCEQEPPVVKLRILNLTRLKNCKLLALITAVCRYFKFGLKSRQHRISRNLSCKSHIYTIYHQENKTQN